MRIVIICDKNLPEVFGLKAEEVLKEEFPESTELCFPQEKEQIETFYIYSRHILYTRQLFEMQSLRGERYSSDLYSLDKAEDYSEIIFQLRDRVVKRLKNSGVIFEDEKSAFISPLSVVEEGAFIERNVSIFGRSIIKSGAVIKPESNIFDSEIGENTSVGPCATVREGSRIGKNCRVGNFVEIKKSYIGSGVKIAHLSYIGDAEIGDDTNVGCGAVFANFDGKNKNKTYIGKNCFIGCNVNLVAPLKVGDNAFIAAGSTVTKDLPSGKFCIARAREEVK